MLTLPGLWELARGMRFRLAPWVVVGLMWSFFPQYLLATPPHDRPDFHIFVVAIIIAWAVREALWWWLAGLFAAIILGFLWDAPVLARWRAPPRTRSAG